MKTHLLIQNYKGRDDYPAIAKFAAQLGREGLAPEGINLRVALEFGEPVIVPEIRQIMRSTPQPMKVFGDRNNPSIQDAMAQMTTALLTPPAIRGAIMPDGHLGYGLPIGGVFMADNAVFTNFVGFDISCMVKVTLFDIPEKLFMNNRQMFADALIENTAFGVGAGGLDLDHDVMSDPRWNDTELLRGLKSKAQYQLGSSGGGNHFANWLTYYADGEYMGLALMTHSGSRGAGHNIASYYNKLATRLHEGNDVPLGYEWFSMDSEEGQEYWSAMSLMGEYASANHDLIHKTTAFAVDLEDYVIGGVSTRHNFAWDTDDGVLHRKGATPASLGTTGVIPSSCLTPSYIVRGKATEDSLWSVSHGFGRHCSRTKSKANHDQAYHEQMVADSDVWLMGVALDETNQAYKTFDQVMPYQADLLDIFATMYPKIVLMGGVPIN